jgi:hypothetical protein
MKRSGPLKRNASLTRSRTPLKRSELKRSPTSPPSVNSKKPQKPVNKLGKNTYKRLATYKALKLIYIPRELSCEGHINENCYNLASEVHHAMGRIGGRLTQVATWRFLCRFCHDYVTEHPEEARLRGLSLHRYEAMPIKSGLDTCKTCGRSIYWAANTSGGSVPLEADDIGLPEESPDGDTIVVSYEPELFSEAYLMRVEELTQPAASGAIIFVSHIGRCRS